jgi:hypothetical protein
MKAARIFWGSFFVLMGVLFLLDVSGTILSRYLEAWRLWPLLFVIWGIAILLKKYRWRWIFAALGGLLLALILYDAVQNVWPPDSFYKEKGPLTGRDSLPYDQSIERASLRIDAPAGAFAIHDSTDMLVAMKSWSDRGGYFLRSSRNAGLETVSLDHDPSMAGWMRGVLKHRIAVSLNPVPVWDIRADVGATRLNFDLRPFRVSSVTVDAGAANIEIRLGTRYEQTTVHIDAGASSVRLQIPEEAGCELREDAGISRRSVSGLERVSPGLYRSKGFQGARQKIVVDVDLGLARLHVTRVP